MKKKWHAIDFPDYEQGHHKVKTGIRFALDFANVHSLKPGEFVVGAPDARLGVVTVLYYSKGELTVPLERTGA